MPLWSRAPRVPTELRDALQLANGERILATATSADGSAIVATDRALFVPARSTHRRIGWEEVDKAGWDRDDGLLWVLETAPLGSRPHRFTVRVDEPGQVVDAVRERVNATVVISQHVPLVEDRGIRVVGRRAPGQDSLSWTVAVDQGIDVGDPDVRSAVEAAVRDVRYSVGE